MVHCILAPFVTRNMLRNIVNGVYRNASTLSHRNKCSSARVSRSFRFAITFILSQRHESVRYVSNINSVRYFSRMWMICRKTYDVTRSNTLIAIWYCRGKWYCWKKPIYFCVALNRGVRGHFVSPFSHNRPVSARFSFLIRSPLMYHYNVINGQLTLLSWYIKWSHGCEVD